ncbi:VapE domain-containing protein [Paracoccus alkenifer]|uniref:Virulence-associated protein E n=1 Tax=Paracoccus alkenifer TaxID=65735 RepID=A0A1H6MUY6_9RHOB|nr:VapE domain-containing protein [Paracoccus alkenifer]SEI03408.1 Virulence-associated protein E [Paracoccus alkenifer]
MNTHVLPVSTGQIVTPDIATAKQFLAALLGPDASVSIRLIWQKGETPVPDGWQTVLTFHNPTDADWWNISLHNCEGYAVFFFVNELDGTGGTSDSNVIRIRANFADLDNPDTATDSASRMISEMRPAVWVGSSPGKHHLYFRFPHHADPAHFRVHQQKLAIQYGGDASVSNPARIMRLPGFLHQKGAPFLVRWEPVTGGQDTTPEALAAALQGVQVLQEAAPGTRHPLGTLMQAPSREWLQAALDAIDPNDLGRDEWTRVYWAVMQAGWSVCYREEIWQMLAAWCARFNRQWTENPSKRGNDPDDNRGVWINAEKQGTSTGIPTILRAVPTDARAYLEAELRRFDPYAAFSGMSAVAIPVGAGVPQIETAPDFLDHSAGNTHGKKISSEVYRVMRYSNLPIGWNDFKGKIAARAPLPWKIEPARKYPRNWTDADDDFLQAYMQQGPGMATIAMNHVLSGLRMYADRNRFNPVVEYLNSLQWDGFLRLDELFTHYFKAENAEFARIVGAKFLIGMVARAIGPGCKRDEMPILEGEQGAKKSTALNILAGDEYFSDTMPDVHGKDAMQHLQGMWLVEVGELAALRKSEVEDVKRFIAAKIDKYRPAYGRNVVEQPRTVVFAGTTNSDTYLKDPTGARRFWPIACGQIDLDGLRRDREQLFAEAVARYRAGERWWLEGNAEIALAQGETDDRQERDVWHDAVMNCVARLEMFGGEVTMQAIMEQGLQITSPSMSDSRTTRRIVDILRKENYRKARSSGLGRPWIYRKK